MSKVTINKDDWKKVVIEEDFMIPPAVKDPEAYVQREKISRYINNHPDRLYHFMVKDEEKVVDCKTSVPWLRKRMKMMGASEKQFQEAMQICRQFSYFYGMMATCTKKSFGGKYNQGTVLDGKSEELLDLFGKLYSVDEVHKIVVKDWGMNINKSVVQSFYSRNLKEIERVRDKYAQDYSDLSLTKKRGRLDRLSVMFYSYYNKWSNDQKIEYSRELRALLEQIRKEIEGEKLDINLYGQINVDLSIEINKSLSEIFKRIPINNLIVAMVAAKKGINATEIMSQLTHSFYKNLNGFGEYRPSVEVSHPVDFTYNWNDIQRKHQNKRDISEAQIVTTLGLEEDARVNTSRQKLLEILSNDRAANSRRKVK